MGSMMNNVVSKVVMTVISHAVAGWGLSLVKQGLITQAQDTQLTGAIMTIIPIGFWIYSHIQDNKAKEAKQ